MTRRGAEMAIAFALAAALLVGGIGAVVFFLTISPGYADSSAVPSHASATPPAKYSSVVEESRRLTRELVLEGNLPGLSVAVAVNGEIVWAEGFGYANIAHRLPVTPLTQFRLGSVTKTLTAAAAALLYDRGRLDLDAPVQQYVPQYPKKQWTVTARQLLADVAGVHVMRGDNNDQTPYFECANLDEAIKHFAGEPLLFEPGTRYRFSSNGWILLSAVVQAAAGEPFHTFMTREVLTPLGLENTVVESNERGPNATSFYLPRVNENPKFGVEEASPLHNSCLFGAGDYLSTPSDLVRFGTAMLKPGLLKAATVALLQTPPRLASDASTDFALGWKVERVQLRGAPARMLAHRATPWGGTAALFMFPDHGLVIAAATNVTFADGITPFGVKLAEAFAHADQ